MEDQQSSYSPRRESKLSSVTSQKITAIVASRPNKYPHTSLHHNDSLDRVGRGVAGDMAFFVLKVVALETTRRLSEYKFPFAWRSLQACQMLCYPPFKWVQRWAPFKGLVQGMRALSGPLLILSIATAFTEKSHKRSTAEDNNVSAVSDSLDKDSSFLQPKVEARTNVELASCPLPENWLLKLFEELEKQGISLPERIDEHELRRFYTAANDDFSSLLSAVKKTIRWRETYYILSQHELKMWSDVVFWHGFDVRHRPLLIVRLGVACSSLPNHERPRVAQAIVSQMEHGILHLADHKNPQIMVLVDCEGLSPFRLPMQMLRSCSLLFQDHFPNCLGGLFVIRLPPVVRMMVQTFMKVLKPVTRQKLKFLGEKYREVLSEFSQELPASLGGKCICATCSNASTDSIWSFPSAEVVNDTQLIANGSSFEEVDFGFLRSQADHNFDQILRTGMMGILMLVVFVAFLASIYDPESSPKFSP